MPINHIHRHFPFGYSPLFQRSSNPKSNSNICCNSNIVDRKNHILPPPCCPKIIRMNGLGCGSCGGEGRALELYFLYFCPIFSRFFPFFFFAIADDSGLLIYQKLQTLRTKQTKGVSRDRDRGPKEMEADGVTKTGRVGWKERERERGASQGKIPCHITQKDEKKERDVVCFVDVRFPHSFIRFTTCPAAPRPNAPECHSPFFQPLAPLLLLDSPTISATFFINTLQSFRILLPAAVVTTPLQAVHFPRRSATCHYTYSQVHNNMYAFQFSNKKKTRIMGQ